MKSVPRWFKKLLEIIDPTYYAAWNPDSQFWEIRKVTPLRRGFERHSVLAIFKHLNDDALTELRYRKWLGLKFEGSMEKHMKWLEEQNKEAKEKAKTLGLELMTEGYMRIANWSRKKYFT